MTFVRPLRGLMCKAVHDKITYGSPVYRKPPALDLNYPLNGMTAHQGRPPTAYTGASNKMFFNGDGLLQYAPHQLIENANWSDRTADVPSGWFEPGAGGKTWEDLGGGVFKLTNTAVNASLYINNAVTVLAGTTYTIGAYVHSVDITAGQTGFIRATATSGTDGDVSAADFSTEGWYAVGFTMGAADTASTMLFGIGAGSNATGTVVLSRPFVVKGLPPGVGVHVPARLSGPPLGQWIGTDDGDEPKYDFPRVNGHVYDATNAVWVNRGFLPEETRTWHAIHNRDFTNAAWVKSNMGTAKDATGLDGVANSASTLTATAANATALQTVTISSAEFTTSVYIKRVTGSGDIDITDNNGTNWTTLTGLSSSLWTRHYITRTQANPVFGIRIVTDTDAIEVDFVGLEPGAFSTSPVETILASVVQSADVASMSDVSWFNADGPGTFNIRGLQLVAADNKYLFAISDGTSNDRILILENGANDTQHFIGVGGVTQASFVDTVNWADGVEKKMAFAFASNDAAAYTDGAQSGTDGSVTLPTGLNIFYIGANETGGAKWEGYIARIPYWDYRTQNPRLQAVTA